MNQRDAHRVETDGRSREAHTARSSDPEGAEERREGSDLNRKSGKDGKGGDFFFPIFPIFQFMFFVEILGGSRRTGKWIT
jgi:hypothetical protein